MFATLLLAGCALWMQTGTTARDDLQLLVRKYVFQLQDPAKATRDQAEKELLDLGPAALDLLPQTDESTPAETSLRLGRVRTKLQQLRAESSMRATMVTLRRDNLSLNEAFEAIEQQTGNKIIDFRPQFGQPVDNADDKKLSLNFVEEPFWSAVDQVLDRAGLTVYNYSGEDAVAVVSRSGTAGSRHEQAAYVGAFRIAATEIRAARNFQDSANDTLQLQLQTSWEPRLKPIVLLQPLDQLQAVDDLRRPLHVTNRGELEFEVTPGSTSVDLPVHFRLPPRNTERIASLKGKLSALLPGRVESFRFTELEGAHNVQQRKAGATVVLDEVRKNNDVWEIRLRVVFDKDTGALESHRGWIFNNEIHLETPGGEAFQPAGFETTRQTATEVGIAYLFTLPEKLKGCTLVYQTPSVVAIVPLEYELKDLPLP